MNRKSFYALLVLTSLLSHSLSAEPLLDDDEEYLYDDKDMDSPSGENIPISTRWLRYGFNPKGPMYQNDKLITYSLEAGAGYRCDQYDWFLTSVNEPSIKNVDSKISYANIGQLELIAKVYFGNLFIGFNGDWGHIWSGKNSATVANTISNPPPSATFHSNVKGHVQDYSASLGYYFKIYSGNKTRLYLLPQVGYQWNFQHYNDHDVKPSPANATPSSIVNPFPISNLQLTYNGSHLKTRWDGAFLGLSLFFQPQRWEIELGGTYAWLQEHFTNNVGLKLAGIVGGSPVSLDAHLHLNGTYHTRYSYTGFLKVKYHLSSHWLLGFSGSYLSSKVDTGNMPGTVNTVITGASPTPITDIGYPVFPSGNRWQSWSGFITIGYLF